MHFRLSDANKQDSLSYEVFNLGGNLQNFSIVGPDFNSHLKGLYFTDVNGLEVTNLTSDFEYSKTAMHFKETTLETQKSEIKANIDFTYKREDLVDFNNKVNIKANFSNSKLAVSDLKKFYNELSGNDDIYFRGKVNGTLNNFDLTNLNLSSSNGIKVVGDLSFVNVINPEKGFVFNADLDNLNATYKELKNILPNILGKTLPSEFEKLGKFSLNGFVKLTPKKLTTDIFLTSEIGKAEADLFLTNVYDIDYANYEGSISFTNFDIGEFFNDPLFGKLSLKGDIKGEGFKLDNINTSFIGKINKLTFKDYPYKNIDVNGLYANKKFDGDLSIDDENFKMKFTGLADLSKEVHEFDFESKITHLNLKETNLFLRDSIANLKGNVSVDINGNNLNNIVGKATFKDVFYTNEKQEYSFKEFNLVSSLLDSIKRIEVISDDIANGYLEGKFTFTELPYVAQNALGSMYTNYNPYKVEDHQYIDFNFTIFNQIVSVFFPKIDIDDNTKIRGKMASDEDLFKLTFTSPRIDLYGNEIKDLTLRTDNQNTLYNTFFSAKEINTEYYKVTKLSLLNKNQNDTLHFKSKFYGGDNAKEDFNLDFYYTFNQDGKSVLGFEKSTFIFKNTPWSITPDANNTDKIIFDLNKNEFFFNKFKLTSGEQKVEFTGELKGDNNKVLLADFNKVKLKSILPEIDSLALKGKVSGSLDFVQKENIYSPEAILIIKDFEVNKFKQGDLAINIKGDNSYKLFKVDMSISNEKVKSIAAVGNIDFTEERPLIDLSVFLEEYQLEAFSPLGQDVISSLRGSVSGDFYLKGFLGNPEMEGTLSLKNAGLTFPYLNVDYNFEGEPTISLLQQSFILNDLKLVDSKYNSEGVLSGDITHQNLEQWFLNLQINTDNLLVLNTKNTDEALYYGTAFMDGSAYIYGLTDRLSIDINAKTVGNTKFVVPLKDVETVDNYSLINFKSEQIKVEERQREIAQEALKGLSLNINLEATKDALAQVVIDEENGSQLTGRGNGNLRIEIDTRGKFNMYGDYTIDNGVYDFKYGGIISKPFIIQKGGTISWNGNPFDANLDVTAIYKAKANPGVLLNNFNTNRREEIDLVTRISGGLFNSKQELDIQLTNVDPTIASELEFVLNDNNVNEKTTQFISLLAFGSFSNPNRINFDVNNTITETASSAIANAFSSILNSPESKFQLGLEYQQGDTGNNIDRLNIDNQVDVSVSTQLSDRVIINGKVGVPVGANTQSSVVGEVKIEVLLNKDGNFRGVIFNRQNEIQYSQQEEGYTQGVGLSYQVNFNTLSGLLTKIGLKKLVKKKDEKLVKKDTLKKNLNNIKNFEGN